MSVWPYISPPFKLKADESQLYPSCIEFKRAELSGPPGKQRAIPSACGETVSLPAGLVLTAVGWQSLRADSTLPFDEKRCVIPTTTGARVMTEEGARVSSGPLATPLYAAGWIRRGPTGIIGSNIIDSKEAAAAVIEDYEQAVDKGETGTIQGQGGGGGYESIKSLLTKRGEVTDWKGWLNIDEAEVKEGQLSGKPREKMVSVEEMVRLANTLAKALK